MNRLKRVAVLLLSGPLIACAGFTPTPYQPAEDGDYGYQDTQIEPQVYRIRVAGNPATSRQTLLDYLLWRASDLALEHGRSGFRLGRSDAPPVKLHPAYLSAPFGPLTVDELHARTLHFAVDPAVAAPLRIPPTVQPSPQYVAEAVIRLEDVAAGDGRRRFSAQRIRARLTHRPGLAHRP